MSNDFASLLSVFRDATSTSTTSSGAAVSSNKRDTNNKTSDSESASAAQKKPTISLKSNDIDPTSTKDPSFSAPQLKERIERILRIQQIRQSTKVDDGKCPTNNTKKKSLHIAICATIVDEFPHEALWRKWMDETGGELILDDGNVSGSSEVDVKNTTESNSSSIMTTAEMYVHAKNPERVRSEWLR